MFRVIAIVCAACIGCAVTSDSAPAATTDAHGITCPGLQCECPCAAPMVCGPHNACTQPCDGPSDCGGAEGETYLGGLCGISCTPRGLDDCAAVGMAGAVCLVIEGSAVCGYPLNTLTP